MIKANITWPVEHIMESSLIMKRRTQHHFQHFHQKCVKESNHEEILNKSKLRDSLPKTWPEPKSSVMKYKKASEKRPTLKETKETLQLKW